ncbi:iron(III) transport system ATP-binding protein [Sphaerochaeta associata]|uniref:Spermidine/putrescine import ATP-binding protein PotA n=1 Tax=Sphaerochaeta associata TaxID=1129264 RepID=A0ABY4DDF9_9SPIR|nr:ABC transporter ATP-binding protein [Sphaerochaeta associata]UOM51114.1 ABC transporter ATP-binding protein [Sphaerochaeta associata]SMP65910.1 iron(III) transport system ATP-binding protein [Sphaerochaeta associata]
MIENSAKAVELVNLSKTFITSTRGKVHAVQNVNLTINPGEFVTLLGPSGCGKTTLLRMIAGFEMPSDGHIMINGEDVISKTPDKRDLGMVFQNYALFPHLNVFNNIAYGLKIQKLSKEEMEKRVLEGLKTVQMDNFAERVPAQMSGGQQQRVALVRALVLHPGVLLFDEPLSNLDAKLRLHMRDEIRRIQKEIGITSIYVTHDQSEAMAMSDKIVILKDGIIQQVGNPQEIYQHPANEFVANFIGKANILEGKIISKEKNDVVIDIDKVKYEVHTNTRWNVNDSVKIVVRPEAIEVGKEDMTGTVVKTIYMGVSQDYWINFQGKELEVSDYNPSSKQIYPENGPIFFGFKEKSLHILEPET